MKTEEISKKIVEGNAIHAAGHPAVDPLTGKTVALFPLKNKEEEKYTWRLDNFTLADLLLLTEEGVCHFVLSLSAIHFVHLFLLFFDRLDLNKDGVLDEVEVKIFYFFPDYF